MTNAFCVFVVLCLINVSMVSSIQSTKSCAEYEIAPMQGFRKERYTGAWFTYRLYDEPADGNKYPGSIQFDCLVILRTARPDGNQDYELIGVYPNGISNFTSVAVTYFNHPDEGRYQFSSTDMPTYNGEYIILDTDYVTYTTEIKCTDLSGGGSEVEFYVLSRVPIVPFDKQEYINNVIRDHNLDTSKIRTMNILSCPEELRGSDGLLAGLLKLLTGLTGGVLGILG